MGMHTPAASAMLLAVGLQETRFLSRRQLLNGPARGFWQFEIAGVEDVLEHFSTRAIMADVLRQLRYDPGLSASEMLAALEHHDVLAACAARCLLWHNP